MAETPNAAKGQWRRLRLNYSQISPRIIADDAASHLLTIAKPDAHSLRPLHDVMIGQQESVGSEQHAGTAARTPRLATQVDDRRAQRVGDVDHRIREGVERFGVIGAAAEARDRLEPVLRRRPE